MKRFRFIKICITACLIFGLAVIPVNPLKVQAAEVIATVEGTILTGTTSDILLLSTKDGKMEIKLDSGTDTSACKILLPDKKIYVSLSHGSDGYLHAVKITSDAQETSDTIDLSTTATVTGTIGDKTTNTLLYVNTPQGEMQIKLDTTTNMSGCLVLVAGSSYNITCARGSDAYMHAISISDTMAASAGYANTTAVTGTVDDKTKKSLLYLDTRDGEMQIVIDDNTDTSKGMVLTPENKLTVYVYRGSDAYMHAAGIVGVKDSSSTAKVDTSSTSTVKGTVGSSSTENLLYLNTPQGKMELKLDAVNSVSDCKVLVSDMELTVTCAYGSDAYMHAIDITGK